MTDCVVMHVCLCPVYVTQCQIERPASQIEGSAEPGIAGRSEPARYKRVKATNVFAHGGKGWCAVHVRLCISGDLTASAALARSLVWYRAPMNPGSTGMISHCLTSVRSIGSLLDVHEPNHPPPLEASGHNRIFPERFDDVGHHAIGDN